MNKFENYGLAPELLKGIRESGFEKATPIQEKAIPFLLSHKKDLIALAQTGTGKTAAFGLPILQNINVHQKKPQALILCPTRELCLQIATELTKYSKFMQHIQIAAIYGGANIETQINQLRRGAQIVVGTPGRMNDVIRRKKIDLGNIQTVVLDEADEMLNMGFQEDLNTILSETPADKNTCLFSATMSKEVANIAMDYMKEAHEISVGKKNVGSKNIQHAFYVVGSRDKYAVLKRILDITPEIYGIIFCRTRMDTKNTADALMKDGYDVDALHGDLSHAQRESVMSKFRHRNLQVLVATDVAARGLDVTDLTHIIHYNLPEELELYTHRSGRTGRKDNTGTSIAIISPKEIGKIKRLEKVIEAVFSEKKIPDSREILKSRVGGLATRLKDIKADHKALNPLMSIFFEKLESIDKEEIIQRFVTLELKRFIEFYKNEPALKSPDPVHHREAGHDRGGFRKGNKFRGNKKWGGNKFERKKGPGSFSHGGKKPGKGKH